LYGPASGDRQAPASHGAFYPRRPSENAADAGQ